MEDIKKIFKEINKSDYVKRYAILSFALFVAAINYNLFMLPTNIVTGGANGISIITKYLFQIDPALMIFLISFVLLFVSFFTLSAEDTIAAIFITVVYPLFVKVTSGINGIFLISEDNTLLLVIFAGVLNGLTTGIIYKIGLNTGGIGIIAKLIGEKGKKSIPKINFIINFTIVLVGGYFFGVNMILYAYIILYISKNISERILLGMSRNKTFYIISKKYDKIANFIKIDLQHDATIFNTKGKYSSDSQKMILTVIPSYEYFILKETIKEIDKKAFVVISDTYEIKGQDKKIKNNN